MGCRSGAGSGAGVGQAGVLGRHDARVQAAHGLAARAETAVLLQRARLSRQRRRQVRRMRIP